MAGEDIEVKAKALVLAAGLGSRLRPLTDAIPKCLVDIGGKPLLGYWVHAMATAGVTEALVNTHYLHDQVRAFLEYSSANGPVLLEETYEPELLGSAGTIANNPEFLDGCDHCLVVYADNLSDVDLTQMLAFHVEHGDAATMLLFRTPKPEACGIATMDGDGRITSFVEKPVVPESNLANAGVYVFTAEAYREIAAMDAFDLGYDVLPRFIGRMRGFEHTGYHLDVGDLVALSRARADVSRVFGSARKTDALDRRSHREWSHAVFLDRDGTVIQHVHHLQRPEDVALIPGVGSAIARLREAGFKCVLVTNQSVVGRGRLTEEGLVEVHREMNRQLLEYGAVLDGIYSCPVVPKQRDQTVIEHADRKPGPGMLLRGAKELGISIADSYMIGDSLSDLEAGKNAGCRESMLVLTGYGAETAHTEQFDGRSFADFAEAAAVILEESRFPRV